MDSFRVPFGISTQVIVNIRNGVLRAVTFRGSSRHLLVVVSDIFCCDPSEISFRNFQG